MRIDVELAQFLISPVMIIIGTRDAANGPEIGRGVGAGMTDDAEGIEVMFSAWQWPGVVDNLRDNGRMAVTFARPSDYVSYQLKGRSTLRAAHVRDIEHSRHYMAEMNAVLTQLGLTTELIAPWLTNRDLRVAILKVEEIYVQTPGPRAGTAAGTGA